MEQSLIMDGVKFTCQAGRLWDTSEFKCPPPPVGKKFLKINFNQKWHGS